MIHVPHFHAAGHVPYAESARLYLMEALEQTMPGNDYTLLAEKGHFTIHLSVHCGVDLMGSSKYLEE